MTWLTDDNNNKCSVEYFGSKEAAQAALDSLKECENCINCSGCSRCSSCSRCSGCSDCSDCSRCSRCSRCSDCSDCSRCSRCSDCSRCSRCSDCSGCSRCSGLKNARPVEHKTSNIPVVPVVEKLHQKVYAAVSDPEALEMGSWHTCETTHCRGGWVVTLAGKEGKALEAFFGTQLAAMKIYDASCPGFKIHPARFFDSNDEAMEDMRKLAEVESKQ